MAAHKPDQPLDGPLRATAVFILPKPKSVNRKHPWTRPDLDNLEKGFWDVGQGLLYYADSQLVQKQVSKRYPINGESPGVELTIEEL